MPTATINYTSDFLIVALQRYRRQHRGRHVGLAIRLLALALLTPIAIWMCWQGHSVIGISFGALSVFMFFAHQVDYWLARRSFRKSPYRDENVTIEFTDAGFHARSPKQDIKLQWSVFTKVAQFSDGFLIFQGPHFFNWIPFYSLGGSSQVTELEALLRSKIPDYRIIEQIVPPNSVPAAPLDGSRVTGPSVT